MRNIVMMVSWVYLELDPPLPASVLGRRLDNLALPLHLLLLLHPRNGDVFPI